MMSAAEIHKTAALVSRIEKRLLSDDSQIVLCFLAFDDFIGPSRARLELVWTSIFCLIDYFILFDITSYQLLNIVKLLNNREFISIQNLLHKH